MDKSTIRHLFFDLDHTLWDFDKNSRLAYQQIFEEHNLVLDLNRFIEVYEPLNLEFWRRFRENEITKEELRYQRLKTAFDACDFPVTDEQIDLFADLYIKYLPLNNHLFEGCVEVLDYLKPKYQLHLITNGFANVQQRKVTASGLSDYFDVILTAEAAGVKKPAPDIFHQALSMANAQVENSVMIGDSYLADIQGAQGVGMQTIWFHITDEEIPQGQMVVHHLLDLKDYL